MLHCWGVRATFVNADEREESRDKPVRKGEEVRCRKRKAWEEMEETGGFVEGEKQVQEE